MRSQEFTEVALLAKVKHKGEKPGYLPKMGRPIEPREEPKYIGKPVGKLGRYPIYRDYLEGQLSYHLLDPDTRQVLITSFGSRYRDNPNSYVISGLYAAPGNPVRASQFYHALIKDLGLTLVSDVVQSPGGYKVWKELEQRFRDVNVYGYDTRKNQLINIGTDDEEESHVDSRLIDRGGRDIKYIANNIRLVATAK